MWRGFVLGLVLWNTISSQPVSQDPSHGIPYQPGMECCPCPGSTGAGARDAVGDAFATGTRDWAPRDLMGAASAPGLRSADLAAANLDDCPCRPRAADSEGAPSQLVSRAMHPVRGFLTNTESQEDHKPLLHPEVGLASSVLQTLREVTDEEYQDALARDAARNAAKDFRDAASDSANEVIIEVNTDDDSDTISEASNGLEVRCEHPLSRSNLETEPLRGILKVDPRLLKSKIADMDEGASNVQENVAMIKSREGLTLKTEPSILKLFPSKPKTPSVSLKDLFKLRDNTLGLSKVNRSKTLGFGSTLKRVPELKLGSKLNKANEAKSTLSLGLGQTIPKLSLNLARKGALDSNTSPNEITEKFIEVTKGKNIPKFGLPSLLPASEFTRSSPFAFKNFLKLKDVELIPPRKTKVKIELPALKPMAVSNKFKSLPLNKDHNTEDVETKGNIQLIPKGKRGKTEILDVLPSASENKQITCGHKDQLKENLFKGNGIKKEDNKEHTEILDALPSASENNHIVTDYDGSSENTNLENISKGDFVIVHDGVGDENDVASSQLHKNIDHNTEQPLSKVPDVQVQDFDSYDDNIEVVINKNKDIDHITVDFGDEPGNAATSEEIVPDMPQNNEANSLRDYDSEGTVISESSEFYDESIDNSDQYSEIFEKDADVGQNEPIVAATCGTESKMKSNVDERNAPGENKEEATDTKPAHKIPSLKERITLKLRNLHDPNRKILSIERLTTNSNINDNKHEQLSNNEIFNERSAEIQEEKSSEQTDERGDVNDLQDMPESQQQESKIEEDIGSHKVPCSCQSNLKDSSVEGQQVSEDVESSDLDTLATIHHTDIVDTANNFNKPLVENFEANAGASTPSTHQDSNEIFNKAKENTCQLHADSLKDGATSIEEKELGASDLPQEMDFGASEAVPSIFPSLKQHVVQPPSLFDSSIVNPTSIPGLRDLLSGNPIPTLPSLNDITSQITDLFGNSNRAGSDKESSLEFDSSADCTDEEPLMSTGASTANSKSTLPGILNPLENINLDIFQYSPLSHSSPLAPKIPTLNLNSFKTKLAMPKAMDLRPVKLQSSLGKDGNLLGATLTFGPAKMGSSKSLLESPLNHQLSDSFTNPLIFENLRDQMRTNADNLLNSPLGISRINPLEALKSTGENIKTHAENTVRNLHHSLASTFNEVGANRAGEKLATPSVDLLEMVTNAHEDMKDRLVGIHTDLKDRLETFQDHLKERTNLPTLQMPQLAEAFTFESPFIQKSSSNLRVPKPTTAKSQRKPGFKIKKPSDKRQQTASSNNQQTKIRPFKISKAASSLTPKTVTVPKLTSTSVKPPFAKPLERSSNVELRQSRPFVVQTPARVSHNNRLHSKLAENNRKPSYSTLSRSPSTTTTSRLTQGKQRPSIRITRPKTLPRFYEDASGFASEVKPTIVEYNTKERIMPVTDSNLLRSTPATKPSIFKEEITADTLANLLRPSSKKLASLKKPVLSLSKPTESPLIIKLRESIKLKSTSSQSKNVLKGDDMTRSPSENNAVVLSQAPMKENVSYKCKMVCYREPSHTIL